MAKTSAAVHINTTRCGYSLLLYHVYLRDDNDDDASIHLPDCDAKQQAHICCKVELLTWGELRLLSSEQMREAFVSLMWQSDVHQFHWLFLSEVYHPEFYAFFTTLMWTAMVHFNPNREVEEHLSYCRLADSSRSRRAMKDLQQVHIVVRTERQHAGSSDTASPWFSALQAAKMRKWTICPEWKAEQSDLYLLECAFWHFWLHRSRTQLPILTSLVDHALDRRLLLDVCTLISQYALGDMPEPEVGDCVTEDDGARSTDQHQHALSWLMDLPPFTFSACIRVSPVGPPWRILVRIRIPDDRFRCYDLVQNQLVPLLQEPHNV